MKHRSYAFLFAAIALGALSLTGCPPKKKLDIDEKKVEASPSPSPSAEPEAAEPGTVEIGQDWTEVPSLQVVHFGYDKATIDDAARSTLKANVAVLKKLPSSVTVRVEGHCDDRGTVEYNIALGQRRANAVRSYYQTAGIAKNRLETISFGEERPVCTAETDDCWAQNRRGVTKVKNSTPITVKPSDLK